MLDHDLAAMRRAAADLAAHIASGTARRLKHFTADQSLPGSQTAREASSLERAARLFHEEMATMPAPEMLDLWALTPFDKAALRAEMRREAGQDRSSATHTVA